MYWWPHAGATVTNTIATTVIATITVAIASTTFIVTARHTASGISTTGIQLVPLICWATAVALVTIAAAVILQLRLLRPKIFYGKLCHHHYAGFLDLLKWHSPSLSPPLFQPLLWTQPKSPVIDTYNKNNFWCFPIQSVCIYDLCMFNVNITPLRIIIYNT